MTRLIDRLFEQNDQPAPRFAFQGTVNWMRALSIAVDNEEFSTEALTDFYSNTQRRQPNPESDTLAFECLLMAFHNVASLEEFETTNNKYSIVRSAIIAWYYSLYYSSKAMLAAVSASNPQTHTKTGAIWQTEVIERDLIIMPFSLSITDLRPSNITQTIENLRGVNRHDLNTTPVTDEQVYGALVSYLKGTANYEKWMVEEKVKSSSQFKGLGVTNFRTNAAKELRDTALTRRHANILTQAFRYRGKANYRDAIYLSYGADYSEAINTFVSDLSTVAKAYAFMVSHYIPKRVERGAWQQYGEDLNENSMFTLPFDIQQI